MKIFFLRLIQGFVFIVTVVFWLVFGTMFWLALITRILGVFITVLLYSMFTGQNPTEIHGHLEKVTDLWFRGFRNAYQSVYGGGSLENTIEVRNIRLVAEIFWTITFWVGVFLVAGKVSVLYVEPPAMLIFIGLAISLTTFCIGMYVGDLSAKEEFERARKAELTKTLNAEGKD